MEKISTDINLHSKTHASSQDIAKKLLTSAGITLNGNEPWDFRVNNPNVFTRIFRDGALGLGESYVKKWWDCDRLDIFFDKILRARLDTQVNTTWRYAILQFIAKHINFQTKLRAKKVAYHHYDLGNHLFQNMLDERLIYSCAYWNNATSLQDAQIAKLDLICRKLFLKPGMRVLDIGCGWGGFAKFAAENYHVQVVGITISKQQADYAKTYCANLPIDIRLQDYRDVNETFDRVVSIGMFEHVGHMNYQIYMQTVANVLKDHGLFLLHTIGSNETVSLPNEWISKYIFPNGAIPTIAQISKSSEKLFIMEDWHNFGTDYDKTLMAWFENFKSNWHQLKSQYDEQFYRMWSYYLLSCAGCFRARGNQLWQIVFSKYGIESGYQSIR